MGTKGTWRRPASVDDKELAERWAETFGAHERRTNPSREGRADVYRMDFSPLFEWQPGMTERPEDEDRRRRNVRGYERLRPVALAPQQENV